MGNRPASNSQCVQLSGEQLSECVTVRVGNCQGGQLSGWATVRVGNYPVSISHGGQLSGWATVRVSNCLGGQLYG